MSGSCGSCRICTRPVWLKAITLFTFWDLYVWFATLAVRRCPLCKHRLGTHKTRLGAIRLEYKAQYHTPHSG